MRYNKQSCGAGSGSRREEVAPPVHSSDSAAITVTIGVNRNTKITLSLIRVQSNIPYKIPPLLGQPLGPVMEELQLGGPLEGNLIYATGKSPLCTLHQGKGPARYTTRVTYIFI